MKFDENLRNLRKEKDYSQEYLAEKLGVTRQTISKWENGSAMPDLKKLTELAEFFEVSMDDLLGLKYEKDNKQKNCFYDGNAKNDMEANQYTNNLIKMMNERNRNNTTALTVFLVLVSLVLAITIIVLSGTISRLESQINGLNNSFNYLQQQIHYPSSNYDDDIYYDVEVNVLKVYPKTPHIVQVELKYAPTSYPKNSKIYYLIPKKDGGVDRLEAEDNNGEFVAKADIDLSLDKPVYFVLDDGENIVKQEVYIDIGDVFGTSDNIITYDINYKGNSEFRFSNSSSDEYVWMISKYANASSADIVVMAEGKEVFRQELKKSELKSDNVNSYYEFHMPAFLVNDLKITREIDIYVEIELENGVVCKDYIPYNNLQNDTDDFMEEVGRREYVFSVGGKTVTIDAFKE